GRRGRTRWRRVRSACARLRRWTGGRLSRRHDVPNLYVIRLLRGELPHHFASLLRRIDFHDRRIAQIELRARDARDQWPGGGDPRCFRGGVRALAHFKIPKRPADIDHAGDPAPKIARERIIEMRADPFRLLFVSPNAVEIEAVRARVNVAGLEEVNVRVDVTRQDELSLGVDDRVAFLRKVL